jgi:hypothetical protein
MHSEIINKRFIVVYYFDFAEHLLINRISWEEMKSQIIKRKFLKFVLAWHESFDHFRQCIISWSEQFLILFSFRVSTRVIFKIRLVLEGLEILRYIGILPTTTEGFFYSKNARNEAAGKTKIQVGGWGEQR